MADTTTPPATQDPVSAALAGLQSDFVTFTAKGTAATSADAAAVAAKRAADAAHHDLDGAAATVEADKAAIHKLIDTVFVTAVPAPAPATPAAPPA